MREHEPVEGYKGLFQRMPFRTYGVKDKTTNYVFRSLDTKDEAEAIRLFVAQRGRPVQAVSMHTADQAWEIFKTDQRKREQETVNRYDSAWRVWVSPVLGHMRLDKIKPADIHKVIERTETEVSAETGRLISHTSRVQVKSSMSAMFKFFTVEPNRLLHENPTKFIESLRDYTEASDISPVDPEEILAFEDVEKLALGFGDWFKVGTFMRQTIVRLSPRVGTRISETLALDDSSLLEGEEYGPYGSLLIDKQINSLLKRSTLDAMDTKNWTKKLKTNKASKKTKIGGKVRIVPLGREGRQIIDTYRERGEREGFLRPGRPWFLNEDGLPFHAASMGRDIGDVGKKVLGRRIKSHWFRHTYATDMFSQGLSVEEVAGLIGNSPEVCEAVYIFYVNRHEWAARIAGVSR